MIRKIIFIKVIAYRLVIFLRGAVLEGLQEQKYSHVNPFEFGIIGSTDTHLGLAGQTEEANWAGHIADEVTFEGRFGEAE